MLGRTGIHRRFIASTRGVAAIEFATILPVLLVMFLASFDGGRAIAIYMKVRSATYTLAAISNQYTTIQSTDMTSIVGATAVVLAPYTGAPAVVISQIKISTGGTSTVSWSYALNGTALTQNVPVTIPSGLVAAANTCGTYPCYLIYAQVSYLYTPLFGYFGSSSGITLSDSLYVAPRSSECILYPPENVSAC